MASSAPPARPRSAIPNSASPRASCDFTSASRGTTLAKPKPFRKKTAATPARARRSAPAESVRSTGLRRKDSAQRLEDRDVVGDRRPAHVEDAAKLGALDLHLARRAGKLHRREHVHRDAGRTDRVAL